MTSCSTPMRRSSSCRLGELDARTTFSSARLVTRLPLEQQGHRPIVHEIHIHHGAEFARLDTEPFRAELGNERLIKRDCDFRPRGVYETRAPSLLRVSVQCELRHHQQRTANVGEREIHFAFIVAEEAESRDFLRHPLHLRFGVGRSESDEEEKAATDLSGRAAFDPHLSPRYPLKQNAQALLDGY